MKKDLLLPIACFLMIIAASVYLVADYRTVSSASGERIGTIYFKDNVAERKSGGQVIWDSLKQSGPLYSNDTIRTGKDSSSIIKFNNRQEIELGENTLIVLDMASSGLKVDFGGGSIHAKGGDTAASDHGAASGSGSDGSPDSIRTAQSGKGGPDLQRITITSGPMNVELEKGSADISKNANDSYSVNVTGGKAKIAKGKKQMTVDSSVSATVSNDDLTVIKKPVTYISPAPNKLFVAKDRAVKINFEWNTDGKPSRKFQVSSSRDFSKPVINAAVAGTTYSADLKPGYYYWRVITAKGETGHTQKFSIFQEKPAAPLTPRNDAEILYSMQTPGIRFSWSGGENSRSYIVQIASDPELKKIVLNRTVYSKSIIIDTLPEGTFYWHIISSYGADAGGERSSGRPMKFSIKKSNFIPAVRLITPADGFQVSVEYIRQNRFLFTWRNVDEISEYQITFARDQALKSVVKQAVSAQTFYELDTVLPAGDYYWTVSGVTYGGKKTDPAKIYRLKIGNLIPVEPVTPAMGSFLTENDSTGKIQFVWKDQNRWGRYKLEISSDEEFSKISKSVLTTVSYASVSGVNPGKIFWRVKLIDKENKDISVSRVYDVYLPAAIAQPVVYSPENNKSIEMAEKNSVPFVWQKVPAATHYKIRFYTYGAGGLKPISELVTDQTKYNFGTLEKLDRGKYCFEIQSLAYKGAIITGASPVKKVFFNIALNQKIEIPKMITPKEVYVK